MLARDIKIRQLIEQREYIERKLEGAMERRNGDCSYIYTGHLYPENVEYFRREGFSINLVESDALKATTMGVPVFLFTIAIDVRLNDEEVRKSRTFARKAEKSPEEHTEIPKWARDILLKDQALEDDGR